MRIIRIFLGSALAAGLLAFLFALFPEKAISPPNHQEPAAASKIVASLEAEKAPSRPAPAAGDKPAISAPVAEDKPATPTPAAEVKFAPPPVSPPASTPTENWEAKQQPEMPALQQAVAESPPPLKPVSTDAVPVVADPPAPVTAASAAVPAIKKTAVARDLFGAVKEPANLAAKSIGFYAHGCLAGGKPLPVNGPAWQVMRLSRNRNWGHPTLIKYIERFAGDAKAKDGWPGLLVGDLSMPRGGPMPFGHASHQVGLDVDIWYRPEPDHELTAREREDIKMESFLSDPGHVNPAVWKPEYEKLLRRAVSYPEVARIFVNPAIKKWLCDNVKGDRSFLHKITPIMGHDDHFHVRLVCPADNPGCQGQPLKAADEGCGKGLDKWVEGLMKQKPAAPAPVPVPAKTHPPLKGLAGSIQTWKRKAAALKRRPPMTMAQLPPECETVLKAASAPVAPASLAAVH